MTNIIIPLLYSYDMVKKYYIDLGSWKKPISISSKCSHTIDIINSDIQHFCNSFYSFFSFYRFYSFFNQNTKTTTTSLNQDLLKRISLRNKYNYVNTIHIDVNGVSSFHLFFLVGTTYWTSIVKFV